MDQHRSTGIRELLIALTERATRSWQELCAPAGPVPHPEFTAPLEQAPAAPRTGRAA